MRIRMDVRSGSILPSTFILISSAHSTDGFPVRTGQEFLEFLKALATSDPKNLSGSPLEAYLGTHPKALAFVQAPKPCAVQLCEGKLFWRDGNAVHE